MLDWLRDFLNKPANRDNIVAGIIVGVILLAAGAVLRRLWSLTKFSSSRLRAFGKREQERLNALSPEERAKENLDEYDKTRRQLFNAFALFGWFGFLRFTVDWMYASPTILRQFSTGGVVFGLSMVAAMMFYNARRMNHLPPRGRRLLTMTLVIFLIVGLSVFLEFYYPLMPYEPLFRP